MFLIQLLLPTTFRTPGALWDAADALRDTRRELNEMFDGVTAYMRSPAKGVWTAPDGHVDHDDVVMVEVVAGTFDRRWWRTYAARLAERFHQDTIHVRAISIETLVENDA